MKRTVARQLALVNWRGVFYERYLLDRGVTALEGTNGAGKTTVMVAAYVVLLPDLRYLNFQPLGEGEFKADDRGIWGRLGSDHAYAALDFALGSGERLVAGVHLERQGRDKGDLNPFVIRGLPDTASMQSLLLERTDDRDEVPAADRLAHLAAVAGGRLTWYDSVGTYFGELFDAGVAPMPMSLTDERAKLNDLLRTSMMGGVSKKLGDGLRSFLLRPEDGLGRSLKRIRSNLDDCRRTRLAVQESRRLEGEIDQVLEAGARMFAAAIEGARRQAEERQQRAREAERRRDAATARCQRLEAEQEQARRVLAQREEDDVASQEKLEAARERARKVRQANEIWSRRGTEKERLARLEITLESTQRAYDAAQAALEASEERVRIRERDHQEAARGMADIQAGLERLHGQASRYRSVQMALARARRALPDLEFSDEDAPEVLRQCQERTAAASQELVAAQGALDTAAQQERSFRPVHGALESIAACRIDDAEAHARGVVVLRELRRLDEVASRLEALRAEKHKAEELAEQQALLRKRAADLATPEEPLKTSAEVRAARDRSSEALDRENRRWLEAVQMKQNVDQTVADLERDVEDLRVRADEFRQLRALVQEIGLRWQRPAETAAEVGHLSAWLHEQTVVARQRVEALLSQVADLDERIQDVRHAGGSFPKHLTDACAAVDGRLLAERFENVSYAEAAEVEARLGPLVHGIVVEDAERAALTLADRDDRPESVWILDGPRTTLDPSHLPAGEVVGGVVNAPMPDGIRSTRLPDAPVVGRQARERLLERLRAERDAAEGDLGDTRERVRSLANDRTQLEPHLPKIERLDGRDPADELEETEARLARWRDTAANAGESVTEHAEEVERLKGRKAALEEIWTEATLLDPPDHAEVAQMLTRRIATAVDAERRLDSVSTERATLSDGLDLLRSPPPDEATRQRLAERVEKAHAERDVWLVPQTDLAAVSDDLEALGYADADEKIRREQTMLASLNEEVEAASVLLDEARAARDVVKEDEVDAEDTLRGARTTRDACRERIVQLQDDLDASGVTDPSDSARAAAEDAAARAASAREAAAAAFRQAVENEARLGPRVDDARKELTEADAALKDAAAQAGPTVERWHRLRARCESLGLLEAALREESLTEVVGKASVEVFQHRNHAWAVMIERVDRAEESSDLADALRSLDTTTEAGSEQFLEAWLRTRHWLSMRVPKHVSEVEDPVEALRRLRRHLDSLVDKLERYEHRLQGDSRDVARSIESRLRKVGNLLNKLNRDLRGVGFGSIEAIQVKSEREARMSKILAALAEPAGRQALFGSERTIEDALDDLFQRHGGRRQSGKQILDYRQYLRLRVEIRRRGSSTWEEARANQMSTGEAIGVGAAIMMVVLTAWEREASLLRPRHETGTLRFLFLDEATRLSLDNLEVLFDLCEALELQLLIAAPEVATSKGNTTYLLERGTDADGRETVHVSGRRAVRGDA